MSPWVDALAWAIFILVCILMGLFGTESRPGFDETRTSVKERWFIHSKND